MESKVFYDLLESPQKSDLLREELQKVTEDYPWFVHGQMLYSKSLQLLNDAEYQEQLHKTSVYAQDREVLYNLIVKQEEITIEVKDTGFTLKADAIEDCKNKPIELGANLKEEKMIFKLQDEKKKEVEKLVGSTGGEIEAITEQEIIEVKEPQEKQSFSVSEEEVANLTEEIQEEKIEKEVVETRKIEGLEKNILAEAVSRVIEKEVEDAPSFRLTEEDSIQESSDVFTIEQESIVQEKDETDYSSFTSWLVGRAKEMHYIEEPEEMVKSSFSLADSVTSLSTDALKDKKKKLLDAFIENSPRITPGKVAEYDTTNLAAESLQDSDFFVTETMADIYAKQGKISKAKKTYNLLSLKYPEKSVYFAARIKKLDKK